MLFIFVRLNLQRLVESQTFSGLLAAPASRVGAGALVDQTGGKEKSAGVSAFCLPYILLLSFGTLDEE